MHKISKLLYYQNNGSNSNQILHGEKTTKYSCGSSQNFHKNPKWQTAAVLKKRINYNISARFDHFGRNFAHWHILALRTLRNVQKINFQKIQYGGRLPFWKTLNAISLQLFHQFWWNLVWWCILALSTWWETKNFKILKSKIAEATILKIEKLWSLQNRLVDFAEIFAEDISPPELTSCSKNLAGWRGAKKLQLKMLQSVVN